MKDKSETKEHLTGTDNPDLVDGKYSIKDLVDVESLSSILEKFSRSTGFTAGVVSYPDQEVLIGTGWRDICTKFHRSCPESAEFCWQSNIYLTKQLKELKEFNVHHCKNGLVDGATPILIGGKHLASLFTGQILFEEPNMQQFRERALTYGYDVEAYLDALGEVPIVTEGEFENALSFLAEMAVLVAELGLKNYEVIEKARLLEDEIFERKRAYEELSESEEKYRRLVESSIDGIAVVQGNEMKFANKALLEMYGTTEAEEVIGHNFTKFVAGEHRDLLVQRGLDRERGKDVPNRYEFKALKLNESEFDVEISVNPISYQGKPARQAFLRDISERKRAEDALRESEEKYRLLVDNLPSVVYKGYKDWSVEFFDEKIEVLTGHSMKEFNSGKMKWSDLVVAEDIAGARATFIKALKADKSYVREYRIKARSGIILWIQERANIICNDKGEIVHVSGVFFDITERKQAEAALKESEAYIKGILNAAPAGIGLVRAREFQWASQRMCEMLGYSADELVGQSARIAYESDEEFERVGRVKYAEIQERGVGSVETRFKRKDGSVLDVLLCSSAVDPGDLSKGAIFTVLDITERKQADNVLKESEQRFRAVLEAVPDLMLVLDAEGRYREVFTADSDLLYAPLEQLLDKKIHEVLPPEDAQQIQEIIDRVLATGELQLYEYTLQAGGIERWFSGRATKFRFQNVDSVLWCARDITQRKMAEEALRESEERHRQLLEASPDPIVVYDMEGRVTYVNPAFIETFGWSSQELLGKRTKFVPEENWPETRATIARMLRGERIQSFETRRLTKDGRILDIQLSSSVFHDRDDNLAGNIVILRDVTVRKRAEDALRKRESELAAQSRHLEEVNAALKVLLKQREEDKADLEERLLANVKELVLPYVAKLKNSRLGSDQMTLVDILESNMKEIVSPFVTKLSSRFLSLTPTEIQVAGLIKDGKSSKEIASLIHTSENTVRSHRFHIRSKLGIKNKKVNLRSYLQSLQD